VLLFGIFYDVETAVLDPRDFSAEVKQMSTRNAAATRVDVAKHTAGK
jgi:hypothetical protein